MNGEKSIKVSIIIPVYNAADYLRRCLDSCVYQTFQEIEVIVVNDCSPDPRDAEIMREYASLYPDKVHCIWHKNNMRQGGARNTGIRVAQGDFLQFVDSDDYLDLTMCEKMYRKAIENKSDMVICNYYNLRNGVTTLEFVNYGVELCKRSNRPIYVQSSQVWVIMISRSIVVDKDLFFPENVNGNGEDFISWLWYLNANKVSRVREHLYHYEYFDTHTMGTREYEQQKELLIACKTISKYDVVNSLDYETKVMFFFLVMRRCYSNFVENIYGQYLGKYKDYCIEWLSCVNLFDVNFFDNVFFKKDIGSFLKKMISFIKKNIGHSNFENVFDDFLCYGCLPEDWVEKIKMAKNKNLCLWGAGKIGSFHARILTKNKVPFEIVDKDPSKHGQEIYDGVIVKSWESVRNNIDIVMVTAMGVFEDVKKCISDARIEVVNYKIEDNT